MKDIIIAIDGHSGCGKSTMAKGVAKALEYKYVDTGAMYRAVTLYFIQNEVNYDSEKEVIKALENIELTFSYSKERGQSDVLLNGQNVEKQIRGLNVSNLVSEVSSIVAVRHQMVDQQRKMGDSKRIVMDGRDIGTNVFPNAELKFFVTANIEVRVKRRMKELKEKGINSGFEEIKSNLNSRDYIDQNRTENPLIQAEDAIYLDTSDMTIKEQLDFVKSKALQLIMAK